MSINGESPGFRLFGETIVSSEKDTNQEEAAGPAEESSSSSSSSSSAERMKSAHVSCPRCRSKETKFCYYNNYNVNQPRHFCKACHRYWTAGGLLRNVPVGAGRRKNRALPSSTTPQEAGTGGEGLERRQLRSRSGQVNVRK